jgi:inhibitor of cysteine peptidase
MQRVDGGGVGREELGWAAVLVLIVAGAAFLSIPHNATTSIASTSTVSTIAGNDTPGTLSAFQTYQELNQFITSNAKSTEQYQYQSQMRNGVFWGAGGPMAGGITVPGVMNGAIASTTTALAAGADVSAASGFTTTNNQVQGVDELDKVKTDGTYLYVATSQTVSIIKAQGGSTTVVSTIKMPLANIMGIAMAPQRLAVVSQGSAGASMSLRLYDVSNPSVPSLLNDVSVNGSHVAARVSQGYLYEIIQQGSYVVTGSGNVTAQYPTLVEGGVRSALPPGSTYYTPNRSQVNVYTIVVSLSMTTGSQHSVAVLTGPGSTVYASTSNIYVVYPNYPTYYVDNIPGDVFGGQAGPAAIRVTQPQNSTVFRVAYLNGDIAVKSAGSFPGIVLNQFSMDEYNGYFRVATSRAVSSDGVGSRSDDVYVLNQSLKQVGTLQNIAPGENIYAVRFLGETGYVVTFQQIDPLFAISFKDPTNPVIQSALKTSGFSDYLHPFGDGYLIGVGKDAMPSSTGNFAWYLGLKLSLFHVAADGTSTEVSRYLIGDRGTDSAVLNDHLAFTFDATGSIMVLPVNLAKVQGSQTQSPGAPPPFGQIVWQGVYVINVTTSGFNLMGTVTQNPAGAGVQSFWGGGNGHVIDRSVIIGNTLYTISQNEVMASDMSNFSTLATVPLA